MTENESERDEQGRFVEKASDDDILNKDHRSSSPVTD
jgi:hypothetical protein